MTKGNYIEAVQWFKTASLYCQKVTDFFRQYKGFEPVCTIYEQNAKQFLQLYNNYRLIPLAATGQEIDNNAFYNFETISEIGLSFNTFGLYYADFLKNDPINEARNKDEKQRAFVYDVFECSYNPLSELLFINEIFADKAKSDWTELPAKPIEKLNVKEYLK